MKSTLILLSDKFLLNEFNYHKVIDSGKCLHETTRRM